MVVLQLLHLGQAALATYGGISSYAAIANLQRYEEPTEKLARYSGEAGRQLRETRVTQAAGALSLAASLLASVYLLFGGGGALGSVLRGAAAAGMVCVLAGTRARMAGFWAPTDGTTVDKKVPPQLPKMRGYSEAQQHTEVVLRTLDWLAYSWVVVLVVGLFIGY